MTEQAGNGTKRGIMTSGRFLELVTVTVVVGILSGGIVSWRAQAVLENEIVHLRQDLLDTREQLQDTRAQLRELRRDLYQPRRFEDEMNLTDLKTRLNDSLHDAAEALDDVDLERCIRVSLRAMALHKRPRRLSTTIDLQVGVGSYDAPAGLVAIDRLVWTNEHARTPWERRYAGPVPTPSLLRQSTGDQIVLTPPPDRRQVEALDRQATVLYRAEHEITGAAPNEEVTTLEDADEDLVLLRAQAEACRELAFRNITKPVTMRGGTLSTPRNDSPSALYKALLDEWKAAP